MATRQSPGKRESREEIDSIIDSYGEHVVETAHKEKVVNKKTVQGRNEYRDFEKETARKCFKKASDWEDTKKISDFLKNSARHGQKKTEI
jgi:hypothetical protein